MVFHRRLSDSKSPRISRTLFSIMAYLINVVVWMVSARLPISNSSSFLFKPLGIVPSSLITVGITVTLMFHSFFSSLARSRYLSLPFLSFTFTLWSTRTAMSTIQQSLSLSLSLSSAITRSGRRWLTFACSPRPCGGCTRGLRQMEKSAQKDGISLLTSKTL